MKITFIGAGYVGLVSAACFSEVGHSVLCVDRNQEKIDSLLLGKVPFYEKGLSDLVTAGLRTNTLMFSSDVAAGVKFGEVIFIAVDTPPKQDGSSNLDNMFDVAKTIGSEITTYKVIVVKSTVPVGTSSKIREIISGQVEARSVSLDFSLASNPEFLKEGSAVEDFQKPDRIVIGTDTDQSAKILRELYAPFNRNHERIIGMDIRSAELTKQGANSMLATRISFMNEMANIAEKVGADIELVRKGIGSDPRIGYDFLYPGCGYGGSCFPKDTQALQSIAFEKGYDFKILDAVHTVNEKQKLVLVEKITKYFGEDLSGKSLAIWGLTFKPETDDLREAPSLTIIPALLKKNAQISVFDPLGMDNFKDYCDFSDQINFGDTQYEILLGADALLVLTEWNIFRRPDFASVAERMREKVIFDGRNVFDPPAVRDLGFVYFGIGR
ncbi:MAG: UDP-glucose 6-dehydrogenase [Acidiferrobacteraceae bacterium]|nr:UDP-glucose 6-dehydrogenase [Acidiferrobacteraceae bacterium]|tara:strand:+ start:46674 stop:47993 length:1320 start_codon:yes stop_codon:yes gene_type:complete